MHAIEFPWAGDVSLVRRLTSSDRRPNLLVLCRDISGDTIVRTLMAACERPFYVCRLPGPLQLPRMTSGTLFLENATAMTLQQQVQLQEWIEHGLGAVQIVSIAATPLYPLVMDGRFLEGLFYRLNVVSLDAKGIPPGAA